MCAAYRNARGVRSMISNQRIIAMLVGGEEQQVLTATENATAAHADRRIHLPRSRHQGMIAIQQRRAMAAISPPTLVNPGDEVMLITTGGVLIRTTVADP